MHSMSRYADMVLSYPKLRLSLKRVILVPDWDLEMILVALLFVTVVIVILAYLHFSLVWSELYGRIEGIFPGPKPLPILGNSLEFSTPEGSYQTLISFSEKYDRFFRIYIGSKPFIVLYDYRDVERVLSSHVHLEKGYIYRFLHPWIGTGLLTSSGEKWKSHRRIITPAFHFKILESYVNLFNENGALLCDKLSEKVGKGPFDVHQLIQLYALDNICEAAMKIKINALTNSEFIYVRAIKEMASLIIFRSFNFWLYSNALFNFSKYGNIQRKALKVIHETTRNVIRERRKKLSNVKIDLTQHEFDEDDENKKFIFLDVLLLSAEGSMLSDDDICEEVSTFMFEGHDTVSSGISFALYALADHAEIQEIAYQEQKAIFGDSNRVPSHSDLQKMNYLEMIVKEAQRLYPSVPMIGRTLREDLKLTDGYVLPKGTQITLLISQLHRNPKIWSDPETFNPNNFLPSAVKKRNPYAYVPFSAGPRNCIGKRFAMFEMKSCLSKIIRQFKLSRSPEPEDKIQLSAELVLVSKSGVKIQIEHRK